MFTGRIIDDREMIAGTQTDMSVVKPECLRWTLHCVDLGDISWPTVEMVLLIYESTSGMPRVSYVRYHDLRIGGRMIGRELRNLMIDDFRNQTLIICILYNLTRIPISGNDN